MGTELHESIMNRFKPFFEEAFKDRRQSLHSAYLTGSALTADFNPKTSDINSVFVLKEIDLHFLALLAPLGRKYGRKGIAAPLIMTPAYIKNSLDVFPIEFLNIGLLHRTVFGEDIFGDLEIKPADLRCQCERELKVKAMALRQAYIRSAGDSKALSASVFSSIPAYLPLFRAIIQLAGETPPLNGLDVLAALEGKTGVDTGPFRTVLKLKRERGSLPTQALNDLFRDYYFATVKLGDIVDAQID